MEPGTAAEANLGPAEWATVYRNENEAEQRRQHALERLIEGYRAELMLQGPSPPGGWGDTLVRLLQPEVWRLAWMSAGRATSDARAEFADDAITIIFAPRQGHVPPICRYSPLAGNFASWAHQVLCRRAIDQYRRRRRLLPLEEALLRSEDCSAFLLKMPSLFDEPFSRRDRCCLAQWPARERIQLLCLTGMYIKLTGYMETEQLWEKWLTEYEIQRGLSLDRPFPPAEFEILDSHHERKRPLSQALRIRTQTLDVYWHREKKRLRQLECIQDARLDGS